MKIKKYKNFLNEKFEEDIRELNFSGDAYRKIRTAKTVDEAIEKIKASLIPYIIDQFISENNIDGMKDALEKYVSIDYSEYKQPCKYWNKILTYASDDDTSMVEMVLEFYKNDPRIMAVLITDSWLDVFISNKEENVRLKRLQLFEKYGYITKNMNTHLFWKLMDKKIFFEHLLDKGCKPTVSMLQSEIRKLGGRKLLKKDEKNIIVKMLKNGASLIPNIKDIGRNDYWFLELKNMPDELIEILYRDADEKFKDSDDAYLWKDFLDADKIYNNKFKVPKWFRDKHAFWDEIELYSK